MSRVAGKISKEALCLFLMCTADLLSSIILFQQGLAVEGNPLLRPFAEAGPPTFAAVKALTYMPAVVYLEFLRRHQPDFSLLLLRFGCVGYFCLYFAFSALQFLR